MSEQQAVYTPAGDPPAYIICCLCGKRDDLHWTHDIRRDLIASQHCFNCDYWIKLQQQFRGHLPACIIEGKHYVIHPDDPYDRRYSGFGGHEFRIVHDDRPRQIVVTHNLVLQGTIPEHFRPTMPDNARWAPKNEVAARVVGPWDCPFCGRLVGNDQCDCEGQRRAMRDATVRTLE